ncbi:MAG: Ig-like domain-containing protein [Myxococcota bacterium]|nr:Ig-like domain-containing protein [Myxococcota bacterium]
MNTPLTYRHFSSVLLLYLAGAACSSIEVDECLTPQMTPEQSNRIVLGDNAILPRLVDSDDCRDAKLTWNLTAKPNASQSIPFFDDAYWEFIPDVAGTYEFHLRSDGGDTDVAWTAKAVSHTEQAFHNYNYYPSSTAVVQVRDELWTAGVYSPEIARNKIADGSPLPTITVGPWPVALVFIEELDLVVVAQKANDRIGLVDAASGRLQKTIWVGDEPNNLVWDPARKKLYVSLGGASSVAIVDLSKEVLIKTVSAVFDPLAMALDAENARLYVASHRSGQTEQFPYPDTDVAEEKDIAVIDVNLMENIGYMLEVASTINHLFFDAESRKLWMSATTNDIEGQLNDPAVESFQHELVVLKTEVGMADRLNETDLTRQSSSTGPAANIHGFALCGSSIYVAAESSNSVVVLDKQTLNEIDRVTGIDTPRAVVCVNGEAWVYASNAKELIQLGSDNTKRTHALSLNDSRTDSEKLGYSIFHTAGDGPGNNRSCSSCHVKGLSDGVIWNAGPITNQKLTRPIRWGEGTSRIGWDGYVGSIKISGYVGGATTNTRPTTSEAVGLGDYLASLMPPPAANQWTQRNGELTELGRQGKDIFMGKASCAGCHPGPISTSRIAFENGFTEGKTDVPSLIDLERIGAWYKNGSKRTLRDAVTGALDYLNISLSSDETSLLVRYVQEITAREFFVLSTNLANSAQNFPRSQPIILTFSYPVDSSAENLAKINLVDANDSVIELTYNVNGRHLELTPSSSLAPQSTYRISIPSSFLSQSGKAAREELLTMITSSDALLKLEGEYTWTINNPALDFATQTFDPNRTLASVVPFQAKPQIDGSSVVLDFGQDLIYNDFFIVSGTQLMTNDLPVPVGPSFGNGSALQAEAQDTDGDGVVDSAAGTLTLSGPGFDLPNVSFSIDKLVPTSTICTPASTGDYLVEIDRTDSGISISWGTTPALGLYVTSPSANLPGGPGQKISGGDAYFVVEAEGLAGFSAPVRYGETVPGGNENTAFHDGPAGGASLEKGQCVHFSVITTDFKISKTIVEW